MSDYELSKNLDGGMTSLLTDVDARSRFLTRTYLNLTGAVLAFAAIETFLFSLFGEQIFALTVLNAKLTGIALLALCFVGPWVGNAIIAASQTRVGHYFALAFYVFMYVLLFLPILSFALYWTDSGVALIGQAAGLSIAIFVALSATVFITRKNFSFLRTGLTFASVAAMALIVASFLFSFQLGIVFSGAMVVLACFYILYGTSNALHQYDENCDVIASVELFASIMMLFFYILRIFLASRD